MNHLTKIAILLTLFLAFQANAQEKEKKKIFTLSGDIGVWYEGNWLDKDRSSYTPANNFGIRSKIYITTFVYYFVTRFSYFTTDKLICLPFVYQHLPIVY